MQSYELQGKIKQWADYDASFLIFLQNINTAIFRILQVIGENEQTEHRIMKNQSVLFVTFLIFAATTYGQRLKSTVVDVDGNIYHTVKIGKQIWTAENLKTTHYQNGKKITNITDSTWFDPGTAAYCNYGNDTNNAKSYGRLYNYYTINDGSNICPKGWHVPAIEEWEILRSNFGEENKNAGKLKETGTTHWINTDSNTTNNSQFTALPGGIRTYIGFYTDLGKAGWWWSATTVPLQNMDGMCFGLEYDKADIIIRNELKKCGLSVRCVKDSMVNHKH